MVFASVLSAFISVGALGLVFGIGLAVASRFLAVKKDKRIERVSEALPGLNCGSCGFAGCDSYAEAIVVSEESIELCKPGGAETLLKLAEILGIEAGPAAGKMVARVHCSGGNDEAEQKFEYTGFGDCNAAYALYGGPKICSYGCIGLGSCIKVCPVDAITETSNGLVSVDRDLCISCEKCIDICPTSVMKIIPYEADYVVSCNSKDKGGVVRKYCSVGCIGCKRCVKDSPDGGFEVESFLATIDYTKTGDRSAASEACPTNCIVPIKRELVPIQSESRSVTQADEEN